MNLSEINLPSGMSAESIKLVIATQLEATGLVLRPSGTNKYGRFGVSFGLNIESAVDFLKDNKLYEAEIGDPNCYDLRILALNPKQNIAWVSTPREVRFRLLRGGIWVDLTGSPGFPLSLSEPCVIPSRNRYRLIEIANSWSIVAQLNMPLP